MRLANIARWALIVAVVGQFGSEPAAGKDPTPEQIEKMKAAMPAAAVVEPAQKRTMLVFTLCTGFRHSAIECGAKALEIMGAKTGAFKVVISDDVAYFAPEKLRQFDAVCFMNTTGELFDDPRHRASFLEWVKSGKGVVGIHAATDCFYKWPEFGELMGGYFDGHPWGANDTVTLKIDEPDHPLNAAFGGQPFVVTDEIYQFREPYSRERLRVLLSLDTAKTDMKKQGIHRADGDFAVSWVREYGQGRLFYCSLGHREDIFWNPTVLQHYLAGIQYALGDLEVQAKPAAAAGSEDWVTLFNGKDLTGWKGLVGNPATRAKLGSTKLAQLQQEADRLMHEHWQVVDGVLVFDGSKQGSHLCTVEDYGDFELRVDWKIEAGGDSGIYLRGAPQVQIWDPAQWPEGSGGLYNNQRNPSKPLMRADKPIGEWNTFDIKMIGERVTVWLNDKLVVADVPLENYWARDRAIYPTGQIELQSHGSKLYFKNIKLRQISDKERALAAALPPWQELFNGRDLTGWTCNNESWVIEDGALARRGGGDIWSAEQFGDFIMELEFKLDEGTNSGIFVRTADVKDCVQTGIEVQILDSYGKEEVGKHDCGAIYDIKSPTKNSVRKAGEWNHCALVCKGNFIGVSLNGDEVIALNLDEWTEPHRNPDGTENKFGTAYKDMPRVGHIGFQDHGKPVWYRNIRIKPLKP
ncbi:MAG: DUF1080 domain-containing protein [Planctomycetes bacterium]|nr:DUF1080 domain-containing protein [Planctomycetota bacterium]